MEIIAKRKEQIQPETVVVDNSEDIINILEKEKLKQQQETIPKSPGVYLRSTPQSSPKVSIYRDNGSIMDNMENLNIDDIIDEHFENEEKEEKRRQQLQQLQAPTNPSQAIQARSMNNSPLSSPAKNAKMDKYKGSDTRSMDNVITRPWFRRHRSSSVGDINNDDYDYQRKSRPSYPKPNSFIKGTSSTNRPYEIIVIHQRKKSKGSMSRQIKNVTPLSSTPPPSSYSVSMMRNNRRNSRKQSGGQDRRYLTANRNLNISQSSSPTVSIQHKIIRNSNPQNYKSHRHKSHLQFLNKDQMNEEQDEDEEDEQILRDLAEKDKNMNKVKDNLHLITGDKSVEKRKKPRSSVSPTATANKSATPTSISSQISTKEEQKDDNDGVEEEEKVNIKPSIEKEADAKVIDTASTSSITNATSTEASTDLSPDEPEQIAKVEQEPEIPQNENDDKDQDNDRDDTEIEKEKEKTEELVQKEDVEQLVDTEKDKKEDNDKEQQKDEQNENDDQDHDQEQNDNATETKEEVKEDTIDESTVIETAQTRENDEYDTDEDNPDYADNYQVINPAFSSKGYIAQSEPAQYLDQFLPTTLTHSQTDPMAYTTNNNNPAQFEYKNANDQSDSNHEDENENQNEDSETKRIRLRREKDEALRRSAMELDRRFSVPKSGLVQPPKAKAPTLPRKQMLSKHGKSQSQYNLFIDDEYDSDSQRAKRAQSSSGIHDIIEEQRRNNNSKFSIREEDEAKGTTDPTNNLLNDSNDSSFLNEHTQNNDLFDSPIPTEPKDRFSKYMTQQYNRKRRIQSYDESAVSNMNGNGSPNQSNFLSPSLNRYRTSPASSNNSNDSNKDKGHKPKVASAVLAHQELAKEGGASEREKIKSQDWHSGIEISWRTTPLPPRDNNKLLLEQNFHCATCGLVLKSNFLRRARYHYCRYTGLIHCNECHKNERAVIPHRVLHDLDVKPATVCCAAKQYLDQMYNIPCITVEHFGQASKVQNHKKIQQLKKILFELEHIKKYLDVCRDKTDLLDNIYPEYKPWIKHVNSLSLRDCVNILSFNTGDKLQIFSNKLQKHILIECDMCRGKGFYCEICNDQKVIYSFQFGKVEECKICKACFHTKCWENVNKECPRCKRRQKVMPQIK